MKKNFARLFAFILIAIMLPSCLISCDNTADTDSAPSASSQNENSSGSQNETVSTDTSEISDDTMIRVMSYNLLHPEWSSYADNVPVAGRDTIAADVIKHYLPDVIGVQEANDDWHSAIDRLLVSTGDYMQACKKCNSDSLNMTTLYYNPKTVKLIDEYVLDLEEGSDIRVMSVAVFQKLADGKQFVVANAHPAPPSQSENYNANFEELTKQVQAELKKYTDIPFILVGDFNSITIMPKFSGFVNDTDLQNAREEAKEIINDYATYSEIYDEPPKNNYMSIDHILTNGVASVEEFSVIIDLDVQNSSDHLPIYADFAY